MHLLAEGRTFVLRGLNPLLKTFKHLLQVYEAEGRIPLYGFVEE